MYVFGITLLPFPFQILWSFFFHALLTALVHMHLDEHVITNLACQMYNIYLDYIIQH